MLDATFHVITFRHLECGVTNSTILSHFNPLLCDWLMDKNIVPCVFQLNNDGGAGGGGEVAAEGDVGEEDANNAGENVGEEGNNAANQDAENGAQNGDGYY